MDESALRIGRGAAIALVGSLASLILAFAARALIARYWSTADYGVFSVALAVLNISALVAGLGLPLGVTRSIAFARGRGKDAEVRNLISASIRIGLAASVLLCVVLFLASDAIAVGLFHDDNLVLPVRVFAFGIPLLTTIYILVSVFRGFNDVKPTVYFRDVLRNALLLIALLPIALLGLSFDWVFYGLLASLGGSCILLVAYSCRRVPVRVWLGSLAGANPATRGLLLFSLPLLGVTVLHLVIGWTDTLMLGSLKGWPDVGMYNAAFPLAHFISFPLGALLLIYMPVTAGQFARGLLPEIRGNFSILTKWVCSITLPVFLVLFLFPETVLSFMFGLGYGPAANALRILSIGFMLNNFLGPNGSALTAIGRARFLMWATLATAALNIGLNAALIPPLGIEGAAIASVASVSSINLIRCVRLYSLTKAQPISMNLAKPTLASVALVFLVHFIVSSLTDAALWMLPLFFLLYTGAYLLATLLTKSFDREDLALLDAIEQRLGVDLGSLKRLLGRFS